VADVMSKNAWPGDTPRRPLTGRDEGCPLVLRYAVWRRKIACVSFLRISTAVTGCEFVKDACRDVRQSFSSIILEVLQQFFRRTQGVIVQTKNADGSSEPSRDVAGQCASR
jgi:hypothetical protein